MKDPALARVAEYAPPTVTPPMTIAAVATPMVTFPNIPKPKTQLMKQRRAERRRKKNQIEKSARLLKEAQQTVENLIKDVHGIRPKQLTNERRHPSQIIKGYDEIVTAVYQNHKKRPKHF